MKSINIALSLIAATAITSTAGTITYFWDINDTGSDTLLYSGEEVINFKMYALMDPEQIGFAESFYDILGGGEYGTAGVVTLFDNNLSTLTNDGELQANNDILNIEAFQMPPAIFHYDYNSDNPILLYEIDWEVTGSFTIATLTSANHLYSNVYTDIWGAHENYEAITTAATVLIPSPASVLPMAGLFVWWRRR